MLTQWLLQAVWAPAMPRPLIWKTRGFESRNLTYTNTFDFFQFNTILETAISAKYSYIIRSDSQCRYNRISEIVQNVACNCGGGVNETDQTQTAAYERLCNGLLEVRSLDSDAIVSSSTSELGAKAIATTAVCPGFSEKIIVRIKVLRYV